MQIGYTSRGTVGAPTNEKCVDSSLLTLMAYFQHYVTYETSVEYVKTVFVTYTGVTLISVHHATL